MLFWLKAIWVRVRHFAWCVGRGWAFAGVASFSLSEVDSFGGPAGLAAPADIGLLHSRWSSAGIGTSVVDGMVRAMPPEPVVQWLAGATRLLLKKVDALEKQVLNLNRANNSTSTGFAWNVHAAPFWTKAMDPPFAVEVNEGSYEEVDVLQSTTQEGLAIQDDDEEKQPGELQAAQNPDEEEEAESESEWTTKGNEIEKAKKEQGVTHETQESKQREDHYDIFMQEIELLNALRIRCFSGDECEQQLRVAELYNNSGSSGHKKLLHDPVGKAPAKLQDPTQPVHQENLTNSNIQTEVPVDSEGTILPRFLQGASKNIKYGEIGTTWTDENLRAEVSKNSNASGILNASANDKATGKTNLTMNWGEPVSAIGSGTGTQQTITIAGSGANVAALSEVEIKHPEEPPAAGGASTTAAVEADLSEYLAEINTEEEGAVAAHARMAKDNEIEKATQEQDVKYKTQEPKQLERSFSDLKSDRTKCEDHQTALRGSLDTQEPSAAGGVLTAAAGEVDEADLSKKLAEINTEEEEAGAEYERTTKDDEIEKATKEQDVGYKTQESKQLENSPADPRSGRTDLHRWGEAEACAEDCAEVWSQVEANAPGSSELVGKIGLLAERLMIETGSCHGIGNSFLWDTIDRCGALIFDRAELVEVCRHEQVQQVIAQLVLNALCMMRDARPSGFRAVTRDAYEATLKFTCSNIVQFLTSEQFQATVKGTGASLQVDRSDVCGSSSNDCCGGSGEKKTYVRIN